MWKTLTPSLVGAVLGYGINEFMETTPPIHPLAIIVLSLLGLFLVTSYKDLRRIWRITMFRLRRRKKQKGRTPTIDEWDQDQMYIDDFLREDERSRQYQKFVRALNAKWWQFWILD